MSKPTKCRVWHKSFKVFLPNNEWFLDFNGDLFFNDIVNRSSVGIYKCQEDYEIQYSTGLKDKNDKDIYEGDIVKTDPKHITVLLSAVGCPEYTAGVVEWLREAFCVCQRYVGGNEISNYVACDCCPSGLEVIGNIFENPELIIE
jgi:uncharacterized phage protein (TIGR01671 family)